MKVLSREQLLLLHSQLINRYGGTIDYKAFHAWVLAHI